MPITKRPKTASFLVRLDLRSVATMARFYKSQNVHFQTRSALVSRVQEDFCDLLISSKATERITSTMEAKEYLENLGLFGRNHNENTDKIYLKQLQVETLISDKMQASSLSQDELEQAARLMLGEVDDLEAEEED